MHHKPIIVTMAAALLATLMACGAETDYTGVNEVETAEDTAALTRTGDPMTPVNDPECAWGATDPLGGASGVDDPSTQASCTTSNCYSNGAIKFGCGGSCSHQHCGCSTQTVCCDGVCSVQYICRWGSCHNGC